MATYSVSLCLSIDAEDEDEAMGQFVAQVKEGNFSFNSMEVEEE